MHRQRGRLALVSLGHSVALPRVQLHIQELAQVFDSHPGKELPRSSPPAKSLHSQSSVHP